MYKIEKHRQHEQLYIAQNTNKLKIVREIITSPKKHRQTSNNDMGTTML